MTLVLWIIAALLLALVVIGAVVIAYLHDLYRYAQSCAQQLGKLASK